MPTENMAAQTDLEIAAHETLVDSLRNTHALEKQQIQVLNAHLELFVEHDDLHARVTEHVVETREQARRLEAALEACGDSASMFKDAMMSVMGLGQSTVQGYGDVLGHGFETARCAGYAAILTPVAASGSRPFCSALI